MSQNRIYFLVDITGTKQDGVEGKRPFNDHNPSTMHRQSNGNRLQSVTRK